MAGRRDVPVVERLSAKTYLESGDRLGRTALHLAGSAAEAKALRGAIDKQMWNGTMYCDGVCADPSVGGASLLVVLPAWYCMLRRCLTRARLSTGFASFRKRFFFFVDHQIQLTVS